MKHRGFTALLLLLLALAVAAGGCSVLDVSDDIERANQAAYNLDQSRIQDAVLSYWYMSYAELPVLNATVVIDGQACFIIDMCLLLSGGALEGVPISSTDIDGAGNDNCDAGGCQCDPGAHYVWAVDYGVHVYSMCVGAGCEAYNTDGYQGAWP